MPLQVKKVQMKLKDGQQFVDGDLLFNVDAQAWARGTRNGQAVTDGDPTYHNNAKYYVDSSVDTINDTKTAAINAVTAASTAAVANFPVTADACDTLAGDIAAAYDPTGTYQVGDYCTYQYQLYKCNTAIASPQATFVAAHWTQVNISNFLNEDVGNLKEALDYVAAETEAVTLNTYSAFIMNTNLWKNGSTMSCSITPLASDVTYVDVQANSTANALIAFLTSNAHSNNTAPMYANGTERITLTSGATKRFEKPSNATYLYIAKTYSSNDYTPTAVNAVKMRIVPAIDSTLTVSGDAADAKVTGDKIGAVKEDINALQNSTFKVNKGAGLTWTAGKAVAGRTWGSTTLGSLYNADAFSASDYLDVSDYRAIEFTRIYVALTTAPTHGMAFYDENKAAISGLTSGYNAEEATTKLETIPIPNSAKYARFTCRTSGLDEFEAYSQAQIDETLTQRVSILEGDAKTQNVYDKEVWGFGELLSDKTSGVANVRARMRLLTDVRWEPLAPVPKQYRDENQNLVRNGSFPAGEVVTGIPYAAQLRYELWMGKSITFETFISALMNKNSVMYDFTRANNSHLYRASAWYSLNCSKAVGFGFNLKQNYATGAYRSAPNFTVVASSGSYTAEDIRIGDVLEATGVHTAIVTDLMYDVFGDLRKIEVSEAVLPSCRRKSWDLYDKIDNFWTHFSGYDLIRYSLIDNVAPINFYELFPYVSKTLGLNYGNKANYFVGDIIKLTILGKESDSITVYKGDTLYSTIDVSNNVDGDEITLSLSESGYYYINFENGNDADTVSLCLNSANISYSEGRFTFSTDIGTLYMVSTSTGSSRSHLKDYMPSATDLANGYMDFSVSASADYIHGLFKTNYGVFCVEIALT